MFFVSPTTAGTFALADSDQQWVIFVQCQPQAGSLGATKIEAVMGSMIGERLAQIDRDSAYPTFLIGMLPVDNALASQQALHTTFASSHLHHDWFATTPALLNLIAAEAQDAIMEHLARPEEIPDGAIDIDQMAKILGVSAKTLRRKCKARAIPCMRIGGQLRFVADDVLRSMEQR